jgi:hypothetical protein
MSMPKGKAMRNTIKPIAAWIQSLCLLSFALALGGCSETYRNPGGFEFKHSSRYRILDFPRSGGAQSKTPSIYVFVTHTPIPKEAEGPMGYDNDNIAKIFSDLESGVLTSTPFNYPSLCRLVAVNGRPFIKSHLITFGASDVIKLGVEAIFRSGDDLVRVRADFDCYANRLPLDFPDYFESPPAGAGFGFKWRDSSENLTANKFIDEIRADSRIGYIRDLEREFELITSSLKVGGQQP